MHSTTSTLSAPTQQAPSLFRIAAWLDVRISGEQETSRYLGQVQGSEKDQEAIASQVVSEFRGFEKLTDIAKQSLVRHAIIVQSMLSTAENNCQRIETAVASAFKDPTVVTAITNYLRVPPYSPEIYKTLDAYKAIIDLTAVFLKMGRFEFIKPWLQKADSLKTLAADIDLRTKTLAICYEHGAPANRRPHMQAIGQLYADPDIHAMTQAEFKDNILNKGVSPKEALRAMYQKYVEVLLQDDTVQSFSARAWLLIRKDLLHDANGILADKEFLTAAFQGNKFKQLVELKKLAEEEIAKMRREDTPLPATGGYYTIFKFGEQPVVTPLTLSSESADRVAKLLADGPEKDLYGRITTPALLNKASFLDLFGVANDPRTGSQAPLFILPETFYTWHGMAAMFPKPQNIPEQHRHLYALMHKDTSNG